LYVISTAAMVNCRATGCDHSSPGRWLKDDGNVALNIAGS
jgi:hypothetical protein